MSEIVQRDPLLKWVAIGIFGVLGMLIALFVGGGVVAYTMLNRQPSPVPGPAPVQPITARLASVVVGPTAKQDACQFGCYFDCLATLAQGGELANKKQVEKLIEYTGRAGRRFIKGDYPQLPAVIKAELSGWSEDVGEISPADRAALVAKFREFAEAFHTLSE